MRLDRVQDKKLREEKARQDKTRDRRDTHQNICLMHSRGCVLLNRRPDCPSGRPGECQEDLAVHAAWHVQKGGEKNNRRSVIFEISRKGRGRGDT